MGHYQITCINHDRNGVITHVGIRTDYGIRRFDIQTVANWINSNTNTFYTQDRHGRYVRVDARANVFKTFLTTDPDSSLENNLDFLPKCILR